MLREVIYKEHNLHIVNFSYIFEHCIEQELINDLHRHALIDSPCDAVIKKLFQHHIIYRLCQYILKLKSKERVVVHVDTESVYAGELTRYLSIEQIQENMVSVIKTIKNILPIKLYFSSVSLEYLNNNKEQGAAIEAVGRMKGMLYNSGRESVTLEKCRKFAKKQGLYFLDNHFFNDLKSKQLLLI